MKVRQIYNAGLYRLVKGFSASEWNKMYVMEVKQNIGNVKVMDVTIGFDGQPKIVVSCIKRTEDSWGVARDRSLDSGDTSGVARDRSKPRSCGATTCQPPSARVSCGSHIRALTGKA